MATLMLRSRRQELPDPDLAPTALRKRVPPPRRRKYLDRWGWYEDRPLGSWTTTRQAEALNLATSRRSVRDDGIIAGLDRITQAKFILDPFSQYGTDLENINVVIIGDIGKAKTSLIKTVGIRRQLAHGRNAVVIDKKRQGGVGEYTPMARALGVESIRFVPGNGGARLNLLDPAIGSGTDTFDGVTPVGREALVGAVIEDTMGRPLREEENAALRRSLRTVERRARDCGLEAVPLDLARDLLDPAPATDFGDLWRSEATRWGRDPGLALQRLCEGELRGLVDEPTSPSIRNALEHPFVHFDVSALPTKGPALQVVMTVVNTWLANVLAARSTSRQQTVFALEEGWHIAAGSTGREVRNNMKLSRGLGLSTWSAFHHISDLPTDSPARALMREAGIVCLYGQERVEDAEEVVRMYHLPPGTVEVLMTLPKGVCLVKVGSRDPVLVQHILAPDERALVDSDDVILGTSFDTRSA